MENSRAEHIAEGLAAAEFATFSAGDLRAVSREDTGRSEPPIQAYTVPQLLQKIAAAAATLDYEAFCERCGEAQIYTAPRKNDYAWGKWLAFQTAAFNLAKLDGLLEKIIGEESK